MHFVVCPCWYCPRWGGLDLKSWVQPHWPSGQNEQQHQLKNHDLVPRKAARQVSAAGASGSCGNVMLHRHRASRPERLTLQVYVKLWIIFYKLSSSYIYASFESNMCSHQWQQTQINIKLLLHSGVFRSPTRGPAWNLTDEFHLHESFSARSGEAAVLFRPENDLLETLQWRLKNASLPRHTYGSRGKVSTYENWVARGQRRQKKNMVLQWKTIHIYI